MTRRIRMWALIEANHADIGPIYGTKKEALAALADLKRHLQVDASDYEVVALDREGFPVAHKAG